MPDPTRWRVAKRLTFAGAGQATLPLYSPLAAGDVLIVRQLTISTEDAAELVVYFGSAAADRLDETKAISGLFLGANGGAAPDKSCMGAWSPAPGLKIQIYASAACDVWVDIAGNVEP